MIPPHRSPTFFGSLFSVKLDLENAHLGSMNYGSGHLPLAPRPLSRSRDKSCQDRMSSKLSLLQLPPEVTVLLIGQKTPLQPS